MMVKKEQAASEALSAASVSLSSNRAYDHQSNGDTRTPSTESCGGTATPSSLPGSEFSAEAVTVRRCACSSSPMMSLRDLPPWDKNRYRFQKVLMPALRAGGQIELYFDTRMGVVVAVKRFLSKWLCESPADFHATHSAAFDCPWKELVLTQWLGGCSGSAFGVCGCYGYFLDPQTDDALLVTEYVPAGDLLGLSHGFGAPGLLREERVLPIIWSVLDAVTSLHNNGVVHGDISLENLLQRPEGDIVLIDFEAAVTDSLEFTTGTRGKSPYKAPEMHVNRFYDGRAADLFSCGVCVYALAVGSFPWMCTQAHKCRNFAFFMDHGLDAFLRRKRDRSTNQAVTELLSPTLKALLGVLLSSRPAERYAFNAFTPIDTFDQLLGA